jgi:hypothetical protein
MKVARVRLFWTPSPTSTVAKVEVVSTVNGESTVAEFPGNLTSEHVIDVPAFSTASFLVRTYGDEGEVVDSMTHSFTTGDLEETFPATDLGHEIVEVVDVPVEPMSKKK